MQNANEYNITTLINNIIVCQKKNIILLINNGRSKSQWQGPSNESGLSVYWAIGNQAGQQLESHDDVVDNGDDDDVVGDGDDDLYIMPTQGLCVCPFVCLFRTKASRNGQI